MISDYARRVTDWDAAGYDRVADPQARWGERLLVRLPLFGRETVMDAGCGTGRVTERLAERVPRGLVLAVDRSPAMLALARARMGPFGDRVAFVEADLCSLPRLRPADAIISSATFHWIADHDALFSSLAAALRPGGRLVAECGGTGNIASVGRALERLGLRDPGDLNFASPDETIRRLHEAGFPHARAWLRPELVTFDDDAAFRAFLRTVILRSQLALVEPEARDDVVEGVAEQIPDRTLDYVRLEIDATRGRHA